MIRAFVDGTWFYAEPATRECLGCIVGYELIGGCRRAAEAAAAAGMPDCESRGPGARSYIYRLDLSNARQMDRLDVTYNQQTDVYVEDEVYKMVHDAAEPALRDALDLAYLTGQRPADVLKLTRADIKDGALWLRQNKTRNKLRIAIVGELAVLLERMNGKKVTGLKLINMEDGKPMSAYMLRHTMDWAREVAAEDSPAAADQIWEFQFRDRRAKAATDKDDDHGITAAQEQLEHSTAAMRRQYVRHRKGKLVNPTK